MNWRLIETAPRDGSTILTCVMDLGVPKFVQRTAWRQASETAPWRRLGDWEKNKAPAAMLRWRTEDGNYDVAAVTHWKPLPQQEAAQ